MTLRAVFAALALALAVPPAPAQENPGAAADIAGSWSFDTERYDHNPFDGSFCSMTGTLTLRPTADPGRFEGDLAAYESCGGEQIYEAYQDVVAVRDGDALTITSTLRRVLPDAGAYQPDDFALTIVHGGLMTGELRSADIAPATFRRAGALVS